MSHNFRCTGTRAVSIGMFCLAAIALPVACSPATSPVNETSATASQKNAAVKSLIQSPAPIDDLSVPQFVSADGNVEALKGFARPEGDFVWMTKSAQFRITRGGKEFTFELAPVWQLVENSGTVNVEVSNDATGEVTKYQFVDKEPHTFTIASPAQDQTVTVNAQEDYRPADHGGEDTRRLSVKLLLNTMKLE